MRAASIHKSLPSEVLNSALVVFGSLLLALGVTLFLQPNQIASGGAPGIAILVCSMTSLTTGTVLLLMNIPLLLLGGYFLGQAFVWRTVAAVLMISGFVDLLNEVIQVRALTHDPVLSAVYGGAAIGIGVGLILKGNASAGGPTIIARLVSEKTRLRPGQLILIMDALIVLSSMVVFGSAEAALLSLLSVFVTGRCIDMVLKNNAVSALRRPPCPARTSR